MVAEVPRCCSVQGNPGQPVTRCELLGKIVSGGQGAWVMDRADVRLGPCDEQDRPVETEMVTKALGRPRLTRPGNADTQNPTGLGIFRPGSFATRLNRVSALIGCTARGWRDLLILSPPRIRSAAKCRPSLFGRYLPPDQWSSSER
jgi:hypothetical protein